MKKILFFIKNTLTPFCYASFINFLLLLDAIIRPIVDKFSVLLAIITTYMLTYVFYFISPFISNIISILAIFLTAGMFYFLSYLHMDYEPQLTLPILLDTNIHEFLDTAGIPIIFVFILMGILLIYIWIKPKNSLKAIFTKKYSRIITIIILAVITYPTYRSVRYVIDITLSQKPIPYSATLRNDPFQHYLLEMFAARENLSNKIKYEGSPIKIYYMIGETVRGDHLFINNYSRNTTPLLNKQDIVNFGLAKSCGNFTAISWKYLASNTPCSENIANIHKEVFPIYFHENKFKILSVSQQNESSIWDIVKHSDKDINSYTIKNQNMYEGFKEIELTNNNKELFILNSLGSHLPTNLFLKDLSPMFTPHCGDTNTGTKLLKTCNQSEIVNRYDNTIVFLDWQINSIINKIKDYKTPSLLIYTSDHGEMLNEKNIGYGHGGSTIENYMVPLFVWVNNAFKKEYAKDYKNLLENAELHKNQLTHEVLWQSIMDIAGFKNSTAEVIIDPTKSLFRKELKNQLEKNWYKTDYKKN